MKKKPEIFWNTVIKVRTYNLNTTQSEGNFKIYELIKEEVKFKIYYC